MFLPITSLCVLSCPVLSSIYPSYRASVLHSFYLHSSSLAPSSLPSSSLPPSYSLPNRLYPSTFSFSFSSSPKRTAKKATHLKLLMTIKQQNIHRLQLIHISMPLKFLSNFGSNFRHGHIERIHGLDFRCLLYPHTHTYSDDQYSFFHVRIPHPHPSSCFCFFFLLLFLPSSQHHIFQHQKNQTYRSQPIPITRQNSLFRITPCRGCWLPKKHPSLVFALALAYIIIIPPLECGRVG